MQALFWIISSGILMSLLTLVGASTLLLKETTLQRLLLPLVAFAAGSLLGGAFLHLIPVAVTVGESSMLVYVWILAGFSTFFALEQFLHWHHCHNAARPCKQPLTYLILIGDGLHNLIGGLVIGGTFLIDLRLGIITWLVAAAHEIPQELGDFAVLLHGGWSKGKALLYNLLSGLTFLAGGLIAYSASSQVRVTFLVPFAAGNFIYIGASDLIPEVKHHTSRQKAITHFLAFAVGIIWMWTLKIVGET